MDDVPATHPDTPHYAGIQKYTHNFMLPRSYNAGIIFNTHRGVGTRREREGEIATSLTALAMTDKKYLLALWREEIIADFIKWQSLFLFFTAGLVYAQQK